MSTTAWPDSSREPDPGPPADGGEGRRLLRSIVLPWEKLRLLYNGILLVPGLAICAGVYRESAWRLTDGFPGAALELIEIGLGAALFGLVANVCFCLGPYAECVIAALGYPLTGRRIRPFLFGCGLLLSFLPLVSLLGDFY